MDEFGCVFRPPLLEGKIFLIFPFFPKTKKKFSTICSNKIKLKSECNLCLKKFFLC